MAPKNLKITLNVGIYSIIQKGAKLSNSVTSAKALDTGSFFLCQNDQYHGTDRFLPAPPVSLKVCSTQIRFSVPSHLYQTSSIK